MPNFGGSRLGFWNISKILTIDPNSRSARKSNNTILFVGDVASNESGFPPGANPGKMNNNGVYGWVAMKEYGNPKPQPSSLPENIYNDQKVRALSLGYTTEYCPSYAELVSGKYDNKITHYPMIWDIAYDSYFGPFNTARPSDTIGPKVAALYKTALASGGGICLHGESTYYYVRNRAICDFITNVGGGTFPQQISTAGYANQFDIDEVDIAPEFLLSNTRNTAKLGFSERFKTINLPPYGIGRGTKMVYMTMRQYLPVQYGIYGAMWKTGALTGYPTGAIISIFDTSSFRGDPYDPTGFQTDLFDNMIISLDRK